MYLITCGIFFLIFFLTSLSKDGQAPVLHELPERWNIFLKTEETTVGYLIFVLKTVYLSLPKNK